MGPTIVRASDLIEIGATSTQVTVRIPDLSGRLVSESESGAHPGPVSPRQLGLGPGIYFFRPENAVPAARVVVLP
ncbi:MAG: hypothetical protein ABIK62_08260 [candidate division WOR-3 bacterium]